MLHVRRSPRQRRRRLVGAVPVLLLLASCGGSPSGTLTPPPSGGSTVALAPGDDVGAAVASAQAGTTLQLAAGTYHLPQGLVIDKDVTLQGDAGGVSLVSDAALTPTATDGAAVPGQPARAPSISPQAAATRGAPVVTVTGGTLTATDVTFRYTGTLPADVVVVQGGALDLTRARVEGGVGGAFGIGNGVVLASGVTASIHDTTLSDNDGCGISQGTGVTPSLQGNTFTGNGGGDVCDAVPVSGVDTRACTVGDDSANPDPARYLAMVVTLADGTPVANAGVGLHLLGNGRQADYESTHTDAAGVALMLDTQANSYPTPGGTFLGVAEVFGQGATPAGIPFVVSACADVGYPSTVHLVVDAPNLVDQTFSARVGGAEVGALALYPGIDVGGTALFTAVRLGVPPLDVRMPSGPHPVLYVTGQGVYTPATPPAYVIRRTEAIDGTGTIAPDLDQEPHYTLDVAMDPGAPAGMTLDSVVPFLNDPAARSFTADDLMVDQIAATPGTYDTNVWTTMKDGQGAAWSYSWSPASGDLTPAGGSGTLSIGGALSMSLKTPGTYYAAGDTVSLDPKVLDPHGNALDWVVNRGATAARGGARTSTPGRRTTAGSERPLPSATGAHGDMHLVVRDPQGTVVLDDTSGTLYGSYTVPSGAPTGTYSATFTWDIGPYQSTPLSASTTFEVQ